MTKQEPKPKGTIRFHGYSLAQLVFMVTAPRMRRTKDTGLDLVDPLPDFTALFSCGIGVLPTE